jgi:hypothetical protein
MDANGVFLRGDFIQPIQHLVGGPQALHIHRIVNELGSRFLIKVVCLANISCPSELLWKRPFTDYV